MKKALLLIFMCFGITCLYAQSGTWTWMKGSPYVIGGINNTLGVYGVMGVPDTNNAPCPRAGMIYWKDSQGDFWFFGGSLPTTLGQFNDIWKYNIASNSWTWMHGPQYNTNTAGNSGVMGVPAASNVPQADANLYSWYDKVNDELWLWQTDNKLWRYQVATNMWTWIANMPPTNIVSFGTQGVEAASNNPGNLEGAATWCDSSGNLILFDGQGMNSEYYKLTSVNNMVQNQLLTNNIWKYNTSTHMWTWLKGDSLKDDFEMILTDGYNFGTIGVESPNNHMRRCREATVWQGDDGMVYLSTGKPNYTLTYYTNPLIIFRYNPQTNNWTHMSEGNSYNVTAYCDTTTHPLDKRYGANATTMGGSCSSDLLWRFGGFAGTNFNFPGNYCYQCQTNELFVYNPSNNIFKWVSGTSFPDSIPQNAGTKGIPSASNWPDAVTGAAMWSDANGNLWLFGGRNDYSYPYGGIIPISYAYYHSNVLWRYQPDYTCVANGQLSAPIDTTLFTCFPYVDSATMNIPSFFSNISVTPNIGVTFNIDTSQIVFTPLTTTTYTVSAQNTNCNVYDTLVFTIHVVTQYAIISTTFNGYDSLTVVPSAQSYQWINCITNTILQNDTNQSLVVYQNGLYAAIVFNGNCVDTTNCISVNNINSINNFNNPTLISITPNPSKSVFKISSSIVFERADVKVFSSTGSEIIAKKIVNKNDFTIDLSSNARGLYYVYIKDGERVFHAKLLKE